MMEGYDHGPRPLPYPLLYPLPSLVIVEDDGDCEPSSFVWPDDPDERTLIPFYLSLNEYNILGSTIDVGSDVAFAEDAERVLWLWMRNMRCEVSICDAIIACINTNPDVMTTIVNQLVVNTEFNSYITQQISTNIYPPRPTAETPDPLCNAATYVVSKIRELISQIYDDLETLTAQEAFEALLGLFGWQSGPLYQLIGLLETNDKTALLAAYDSAAPDLVCQLIEDELDQDAVLDWVHTTYPPPSVLGDAIVGAITATADEGKWAQWIAVGATMTGAGCDCGEPPAENCFNLGFTPPQAHYGSIIAQTDTYIDILPDNTSLGSGIWIVFGQMPSGDFCHFDHHEFLTGTFTPTGGNPDGFGANLWPTGTEEDINATDYDVTAFTYISSTAFTIRIYIG